MAPNRIKVTTLAGPATYENVHLKREDNVLIVEALDGRILNWISPPWLVEFIYS